MYFIRFLGRVAARVRGSCLCAYHGCPTDRCIFLLSTKTKLAPLKALTVPRLELNAAVLLARWLRRLSHVLASQLADIVGIHAWSDSTFVYCG